MLIFPKYKRRHGGGQLKNLQYAQIQKPAWWRQLEKTPICPNPNLAWWRIPKKTPNIPALETCIAKSQQFIIKNK
jgi:hypothetical protein